MSDSVSRTVSHFDLLRAISHAIGIPAMRSTVETNRAIQKLFATALRARFMSDGSSRTTWITPNLRTIPRMGGRRIRAKNRAIATKYTAYLRGFFDDALSEAWIILFLTTFSLFHTATYFFAERFFVFQLGFFRSQVFSGMLRQFARRVKSSQLLC